MLTDIDTRGIVYRTAGHSHGPITRLVSPSDLGQWIKPFVFLDHFVVPAQTEKLFGMHPHSGIATVTLLLDGSVAYEDSTGASGQMHAGSVEWMQAGGGVWHATAPVNGSGLRGYQLWLALPAALENSPASSQYLPGSQVPVLGPARLVLGRYGGAQSPVQAPVGINYLHVQLAAGQRWRYDTPAGHDVAWVAVNQGSLRVADTVLHGELAVFQEGEGALEFEADAEGDVDFVLGTAAKHPHELVLGSYSVHTSEAALQQGQSGIRRIASELRAQGRLGR